MPEYMFAMAPCARCGRICTFHPERVPSIRLNAAGELDPTAPRQPICRSCWDDRQAYRRANGLPEEPLLPGAYGPLSEEDDRDG